MAPEVEGPPAPEVAHEFERRILGLARRVNASAWEMAALLYEWHEHQMWRLAGYETLNEFLAQPELGLSRTQFFRLTRLWRDLAVVKRVPTSVLAELDPSKAELVAPKIMRGEVDTEEAFADARVLGVRDLRERYGPEPDVVPEKVKCEACGSWYRPGENE